MAQGRGYKLTTNADVNRYGSKEQKRDLKSQGFLSGRKNDVGPGRPGDRYYSGGKRKTATKRGAAKDRKVGRR